jgi:uncharacterized membrane protein
MSDYMPPPPDVPPAAAAPASRDNTELFGILGIVLAVICCPLLGILFGYLSMQEAKKLGKSQTLGKVGFWLGIALLAASVIATIIAVCAGGFAGWNNRDNY